MGFSMGTGEVTRYIGKYGTARVSKAVLIGTLGPYLVKAADNPEGVDAKVFEGIKAAIRADRPTFLMEFLKNFYNYDVTGGKLVSSWSCPPGRTACCGHMPTRSMRNWCASSRDFPRLGQEARNSTAIKRRPLSSKRFCASREKLSRSELMKKLLAQSPEREIPTQRRCPSST